MPNSPDRALMGAEAGFAAYAESENQRVLRSAYLIGGALFLLAFVYEALVLESRFAAWHIGAACTWVALQAGCLQLWAYRRKEAPGLIVRSLVVISNGWMWAGLSAVTTHPNDAAAYANDFVLIQTVFAYLCSGLRLKFALISGLSIAAGMLLALALVGSASTTGLGHSVFVLLALNLVGALGRAWIEKNQRAEYALRSALQEQTRTDPLTGAKNRLGFREHLELVLEIARRESRYLGIAMLDLDAFKPINDAYGHSSGDAMLRHTVDRMRSCAKRATDAVARFGGDEFGAVWVGRSPEDIHTVANALHAETRSLTLRPNPANPDRLASTSASLGVLVVYPPDRQLSLDALIDAADQLATRVKKLGGCGILIRELDNHRRTMHRDAAASIAA